VCEHDPTGGGVHWCVVVYTVWKILIPWKVLLFFLFWPTRRAVYFQEELCTTNLVTWNTGSAGFLCRDQDEYVRYISCCTVLPLELRNLIHHQKAYTDLLRMSEYSGHISAQFFTGW